VFLLEGWEGLAVMEAQIDQLRATVPASDVAPLEASAPAGVVPPVSAAPAVVSPVAPHPDSPHYATLSLLAHRLRGSAGLYGFPQLAGLAAIAERLTESRPRLQDPQREQLLDVLELVTLGLRRALNDVSAGRNEGEVGLHFAQVGGASRLQALLRSAPLAFTAPRSARLAPLDDLERPAGSTDRPASTGLSHDLQVFAQNNAEIWSYFAPEVREYLEALRTELDRSEQDQTGPDLPGPDASTQADVTRMFRAAHTIKGSAFMVGLSDMGHLAHGLEDLLTAVREQTLPLRPVASTLLAQGVTLLEQMLLTAEGQADLKATEIEGYGASVRALLRGEVSPANRDETEAALPVAVLAPTEIAPLRSAQSIRVGTERLDKIMDGVGQLVMSRARLDRQLARLSKLEDSLQVSHARVARVVRDFEERYLNPDLARTAAPTTDAAPVAGAENSDLSTRASDLSTTVRELFEELEFDSYDDINILARSVTELSADLNELRQQFQGGSAALRAESDTFSKLLRELRGDVARTRRVAISQAYTRPRRWTRGQSQAELVTLGGELEVDAFLTQGLSEVLMHLVTNAYSHAFTPGDEGQQARRQLGKPQTGRVVLGATRRGSLLDVIVSDDGHGIQVQNVRDQALARGLRSARELAELGDEEALRLIFLPGLSTAAQLTNEAGRGVGMDIVASTVRRLGGELLVASVPGEGTTFTLRLPLTQQVVELLTVRVGPHPLGFPAASIVRLLEVESGDVSGGVAPGGVPGSVSGTVGPQKIQRVSEGERVSERKQGEEGLQDGLQPQLGLDGSADFSRSGAPALRRLPDGTPLYFLQTLWGQPQPTGTLKVLVMTTQAGPVGFAVDDFGGIAEAVVSPPGLLLGALDYVSGTTVTPDGEPVLLPDTAGLVRQAARSNGTMGAALDKAQPGPVQRKRLLLVDDSLSVRRVVSRMLERAGYSVLTASDGQEALDLLRADNDVAAVLTDLEMPRLNGFEVIEEVRRRGLSMPIVVMTTRAGEKHQRLAFQLGANDYFSKPVDEALLTRCLERLTMQPSLIQAGRA
jgi:chemosensory pili system protein ChpA (sensor histidine kinase/response regulator)